MNIALFSPNQNIYSETFIHAHKSRLKGNIFYYYGPLYKTFLDGHGSLSKRGVLYLKIKRKVLGKTYTWYFEQLIKKSLIRQKISVVLAEYGPKAHTLLPIVKSLDLPLIVHFHGFDASIFEVIKKHKNYKEVFDTAQYIVVVSKKMYKDLLELGCPEKKLIYNVYGPQEMFFEVESKFSTQQFIAVGRFVNKKAPYYLILAFKDVVKKFPEAKLIMAGEGELLSTCKDLVKYFDLQDNIRFPGVVRSDEFQNYLSESIAFVQHSVTAQNGDSEGTPVSILEASAAGLPVISTRHGGISDIIIEGETGFLVEEHDVNKMSDQMIKILENPEMAKKMGQSAKENIKKNYTLERHINLLDSLIAKVTS